MRTMYKPQYALVAYIKHPVGEIIERLRRELHPDLPHLPAHVTVLPPRSLAVIDNLSPESAESFAIQSLTQSCRDVEPFEIVLGEVATFVPVTPTVFIRVAHAAYRLRELHDRLNSDSLLSSEQWPYMPHLTVVKMPTVEQAHSAFDIASQRWGQYSGSRRIAIEELTFVREGENNTWVDLAAVHLGRSMVSRAR